jgi:hypothetical protein
MDDKKTNNKCVMLHQRCARLNTLDIFSKYINNNNKLIPFKIKNSYRGKIKYLPPVSKEWKNSIYVFNLNILKNLPSYDININKIIKYYFNLYFNHRFLLKKKKSFLKYISFSFNKIHLSKAEIKHTNNKAILTIYTYNREKISLLKKIRLIKQSFYQKIQLLIFKNKQLLYCDNNLLDKNLLDTRDNLNKDIRMYNKKIIKSLLYNELVLLRNYKLRLNLNKYKFEDKLLHRLKNLIIKYYNKKVEFNIINMRSIILNSDLFTQILTLKLKNKKARIFNIMNFILNKAILPKVNRILEKSKKKKIIDINLIENKYKNFNISSILSTGINNDLSVLLNNLYYNVFLNNNFYKSTSHKIYEIIFHSINYKNLGGIRLEAKGRLTKRNRADRAIYKLKWKGGLKNIDSSYKGISTVNMRGFSESNLEYSIFTSKRRVGAFAVKGWISGK